MTLTHSAKVPASLSGCVLVCTLLPALSLPICLLCQSEGPYTLSSATDQDSYILSKCHFTSISPDTFTEEVFHVVTCACVLLVVQRVGGEPASKDAMYFFIYLFFCLDQLQS